MVTPLTPSTDFYHPDHEITLEVAHLFDKVAINTLERSLITQGLDKIIYNYAQGAKVLDYGSGTGISTDYLFSLGLDVSGVDCSKEMIRLAKKNYPHIEFKHCLHKILPYPSQSFDLVYSSLVLFEFSTKKGIIHYLKEAMRVLKDNGIFIAITGNKLMYQGQNFLIFENDFPENKNLKSGDLARVSVKGQDRTLEFRDYFWTQQDYAECFKKSGFILLDTLFPILKENFCLENVGEKTQPPFIQFIAKASSL